MMMVDVCCCGKWTDNTHQDTKTNKNKFHRTTSHLEIQTLQWKSRLVESMDTLKQAILRHEVVVGDVAALPWSFSPSSVIVPWESGYFTHCDCSC